MGEKKEVYVKLCERLHYSPSSYLIAILEKMITPEEGMLLLELPGESRNLAEKSNLSEKEVESKLHEFLQKGLVVSTRKGTYLVRDVTQLHDASLASAERFIDEELLDLWKEFYEAEWCQALADQWNIMEKPVCGVIPLWKSIQKSPQIPSSEILPEENIIDIINGAENIAVVPCSCRRPLRRCNAPLEVCMQFNRWAQYAVDRGAGKMVSTGEALAINEIAEESGLVHVQPRITPGLSLICNCCGDCCALIDPGVKFGGLDKALEKSRFRAKIDYDLCTECYECVDRCPLGAIERNESLESDNKPNVAVIGEQCFGCGSCVVGCTFDAIKMTVV